MKILMVSSFLPYPLFSGGQVRLYNLIREISEKNEITLICEKRDSQTEEDIEEIEKICKKVIVVGRQKQWSIRNLLNAAISPNSFLVTGHTNSEMKQIIKEELEKENFDLIHVETYYVMQNLPEVSIPVVLVEHNIEYQIYQKYVDQAFPLLRPLLSIDVAKIKKEEEKFWKKAEKLVAVSSDDKKVMEKSGLKPKIVANGVDTEKFSFNPSIRSARSGQKKVLFIGDFKWIQNRDAAKFIIEEIWPEIRSKIKNQKSNISLWVVGRKIPDSLRNLTTDPNIIFDEEASGSPTEQLFQEADILLAPIRVGGGTSYKILESMSCGTPVVTMPISADAIEAKDEENIIIGNSASELAGKTLELLTNEKLHGKIAKNARKLTEEKYTWKKIAGDLEEVYQSVIL